MDKQKRLVQEIQGDDHAITSRSCVSEYVTGGPFRDGCIVYLRAEMGQDQRLCVCRFGDTGRLFGQHMCVGAGQR